MLRPIEEKTERQRDKETGRVGNFHRSIALSLCACVSLSLFAYAQRRPILRPSAHNYLAGKFILLTRDERPQALQQPRMLARVADHDLITPPARVMTGPETLIEWAKSVDYSGADGVIVSLDAIAGDSSQSERPEILKWIRARRSSIPIYALVSGASDQSIQSALNLGADSALDFLLISGEVAPRPNLSAEIAARKLSGKVAIGPGAEAATMILLSRMLNRRFGFAPKIYPIFSSVDADAAAISQKISATIRNAGGVLPDSPATARGADAFLFVHAPRTTGANLDAFVEGMARAAENGAKIALVDLSETKDSKEALIAGLRRLKLLDKLIAYASSEPGDPGAKGGASADAIIRAITHVSAFLTAIKFMRDDIDRVLRFDRANFELLFSSYLTDWAYALSVRPALDDFVKGELKADPNRLPNNSSGSPPDNRMAATERAEAFIFSRIKQSAEELFNEQFRRNVHAILLSGGERAQLQLSTMQRLLVRLPTRKTSEVEIRQSVYIPQVNFSETSPIAGHARWFIENEELDSRIARRFVSTDWGRFKNDVAEVDITIKLSSQSSQQGQSQESYAISSSRKGETRRVTITAPSNQGVFYALSKLESLGADGRLAENFQISESPAVARRGLAEAFKGSPWSNGDRSETLRFLGLARMNRYIYAPKDDDWRRDYAEQDLEGFRQLMRAAEENFVRFVYAIRPGSSFAYSSDEDTSAMIRKLEEMASLGANGFALFFDDAPTTLQNPEDRARLKSLAAAQAHLINLVYGRLKRAGADFELYVAPPVFVDSRASLDYMKELGAAIPQDILFLQSSAGSGATAGGRSVVWDNFAANDNEPWRLFIGPKRSDSGTISEGASGFIATAAREPRVSMLPIATAADYAWEPRNYNPQQAFDHALNLLYDERARQGLRAWAGVYDDSLFKPLFQHPAGAIDTEAIGRKLTELQRATEMIGVSLNQGLLRGELIRFIERMKNHE
ncbi:MAG: DUF4127 family protein [Chloracidobacterium sp.]|nr:DUF4127 family protein [Chloracidobacterium sp.]